MYSHIQRLLPSNANSLRAKDGSPYTGCHGETRKPNQGEKAMTAVAHNIQYTQRQEAAQLIRGVLDLYAEIYPGDERLAMAVDTLEQINDGSMTWVHLHTDATVAAVESTLAAWNEAGMDYHNTGKQRYVTAAWICAAILYAFQPDLRLADVHAAIHMAEFEEERRHG